MKKRSLNSILLHLLPVILMIAAAFQSLYAQNFRNPAIFADVPDMSMIRVGNSYYMSSTTMHLSPGLPIMKSKDLTNWEIVSYAYDTLGNPDALKLEQGKNAYGQGSWASSLRYHKGVFYVSTFSSTTGRTYIFSTKNIDKGPWKRQSFSPALHDHSLFFDDDDRVYMVYGSGKIMLAELSRDLSGLKPDTKPQVLIENASLAAGTAVGLPAEGSQLFKVNGKYFLFNICWPKGGMRTVLIHRADQLKGPYEGRIGLQDKGVAQGGLVQTSRGAWYAYLFRDFGAIGRVPYLVPVSWADGWPVIGRGGKVPDALDLPEADSSLSGIVYTDEFDRKAGQPILPQVWQWNHNPDNSHWSLRKRSGYLRLTTSRTDSNVLQARNTLTQRTFGPKSSAHIKIDVSGMKDGDISGLVLLQKKYGWIGVKMMNGKKFICRKTADGAEDLKQVPLKQNIVYLRADCDFRYRKDVAVFYYSLDGSSWTLTGEPFHMQYTIPHFMGYRFGLFSYATLTAGGYTDFDYFRVGGRKDLPDSASPYQRVQTYINPVLPGDHPDPTLLKVGDDFYHCGSSFHFNPYMPIYHSKDLVHWEIISRVLSPEVASFVTDKPSAGTWQGAITYFYGHYWIYFSSGGQWLSRADAPTGPWSRPVQVRSNPETGNLGYDNSIFVDDDGKPYMVIKNGQKVNRLQELGRDGQLTGHVINMDWINAKLQYSWAEGPVMCKRNGYYYYFPAGDVSGGQYVLRGTALTGDSTKWERLGNFFKPIMDGKVGFRSPNHIAAPVQLSDGSWWTIGQSYEKYGDDDWSGMGRQTALYPITWEGDRPWGMAPTTAPITRPSLPKSGIAWRSVNTDYFDSDSLGLWWHFLNRKAASAYSLKRKAGWLTLTPDTGLAHLVQKETDHFYTAVTKIDLVKSGKEGMAGLYLTNGNQKVQVKLYSHVVNDRRKIIFQVDTAVQSAGGAIGDVVWLKLVREEHLLTGFYSADGKNWTAVGKALSAVGLDKVQPDFNSWVGTSVGLFAEKGMASFDFFICKDGTSILPAVGFNNQYGLSISKDPKGKAVMTSTDQGGWLMISGVELGRKSPSAVSVLASSATGGKVEIWMDDIGHEGQLLATLSLPATSGKWRSFEVPVKEIFGQHDILLKVLPAESQSVSIQNIRFMP